MEFTIKHPEFCIKFGASLFRVNSTRISEYIDFMSTLEKTRENQDIVQSMLLVREYPEDFHNLEIKVDSVTLFRKLSRINLKADSRSSSLRKPSKSHSAKGGDETWRKAIWIELF